MSKMHIKLHFRQLLLVSLDQSSEKVLYFFGLKSENTNIYSGIDVGIFCA